MANKNDTPLPLKDNEPGLSLGHYLQRERKKKNLSIQEIAKATKVPAKALAALESDDRKQLPVSVFAKGFIKIYSGYLGLDQNDILKRFQNEWGTDSTTDSPEMLHEESMAQIAPFYFSVRFYLTIFIVLLLIGLAYFFFNANDPGPQDQSLNNIREMYTLPPSIIQEKRLIAIGKISNQNKETQYPVISLKSAGKIEREEDDREDIILATLPSVILVQKKIKEKAIPVSERINKTTLQIATPNTDIEEILPEEINEVSPSLTLPLDLHISFLARTRISISQDESSPAKYIFSTGEESSWTADKTISMQVEKPENIRITLNGKTVPLPKSQSSPVDITLPAYLSNL